MNQPISKISGVIITYNEEKNIARCLDSLSKIVDEIIVVDSFSTDSTKDIVSRYNVRYYENKFEGYVHQKNFATKLAKYEYILSLDADEELSTQLETYLLSIKNTLDEYDAYSFNRLSNYCGYWIYHSGWYPDRKIRLWKKGKASWEEDNFHDKITLSKKSKIKKLNYNINHYTFHTIKQHIEQMNKFTEFAATDAFKKKKPLYPFIHLFLYPIFVFIKNYFFKLGFLDGYGGLMVCASSSYYRFLKYAKYFELKNNTNNNIIF